ncbi:MAG TPA: sigma 54-interacting transcriptional regulator [Rhodothermales bacterium]
MFCEISNRIRLASESSWGRRGTVYLVGRSTQLRHALERAVRFASVGSPVLVTGESGVGKELFARALYLLGQRCGRPFYSVNCAQYQNDELLVSELFGHRKGSFTGAVSDRDGLFQAADGGVVFLDEVGELTPQAQAMLLRVLSEGEVRPLGNADVRRVDVRVIAATNRPLRQMVEEGRFRPDLYYRLRYLQLHVPPIRARADDWRLLVDFYLNVANRNGNGTKTLSSASWEVLGRHDWPGNVREIRSVVDVGHCLAEGPVIEPENLYDVLREEDAEIKDVRRDDDVVSRVLAQMVEQESTFWEAVREPFLARDLNRREVREIVDRGLRESGWSYKALLELFNLPPDEYLRFMDFLRHHRLKPPSRGAGPLVHRTEVY